jgi:hypothetical protein
MELAIHHIYSTPAKRFPCGDEEEDYDVHNASYGVTTGKKLVDAETLLPILILPLR